MRCDDGRGFGVLAVQPALHCLAVSSGPGVMEGPTAQLIKGFVDPESRPGTHLFKEVRSGLLDVPVDDSHVPNITW